MTAPRIRAGDTDRQRSVERLARHYTEGRLDSFEYDQRVQKAYASVYLDELPALFTDLPPEPGPVAIHPADHQDAYEKAWRQGYGRSTGRCSADSGVPNPRGAARHNLSRPCS